MAGKDFASLHRTCCFTLSSRKLRGHGSPTTMKRFIITGTPGAGKTVIIRQLEIDGFSVVEEAATDVVALKQGRGLGEPWSEDAFIDEVAALQRHRQLYSSYAPGDVQF